MAAEAAALSTATRSKRGDLRNAVRHHHRQAEPLGEPGVERAVAGNHDQPGGPPAADVAQPLGLLGRIVARRDDDEVVAVAARQMLERRDEGGEHRVGEVRHDHPGEPRLARAQPRGAMVAHVAEPLDRRLHPGRDRRRHAGLAVDDVGDRRHRHVGRVGHHAYGRTLARSGHSPPTPGLGCAGC